MGEEGFSERAEEFIDEFAQPNDEIKDWWRSRWVYRISSLISVIMLLWMAAYYGLEFSSSTSELNLLIAIIVAFLFGVLGYAKRKDHKSYNLGYNDVMVHFLAKAVDSYINGNNGDIAKYLWKYEWRRWKGTFFSRNILLLREQIALNNFRKMLKKAEKQNELDNFVDSHFESVFLHLINQIYYRRDDKLVASINDSREYFSEGDPWSEHIFPAGFFKEKMEQYEIGVMEIVGMAVSAVILAIAVIYDFWEITSVAVIFLTVILLLQKQK